MKTNIIISKKWNEDNCALYNIKFTTLFNNLDFVISGDYYLTPKHFVEASEQLIRSRGKVLFGNKKGKEYCELTISQSTNGYKNINYHLISKCKNSDLADNVDVGLNTGYVIEPAVLDRIAGKLKDFYNAPEGSQISLIYDYKE